jgi:periplasmic protein TonB
MPRDLFGDVTRPSISIGNRKWYTVPVSLLSHSIVIAMFLVLPILAAPYMPDVFNDDSTEYLVELIPPPPLPPDRPITDLKPPADPSLAPIAAPDGITKETDLDIFKPIDTPIGTIVGVGDIDSLPPPPVVKPPAPDPGPVRVGGAIRQPIKVGGADPVYPAIAQAARVQGIVIIEATIGADGHVINARILRSVPLLDQAALDAVRQWQYTPTMLNGVPVPVIMTVTATFTLSR